MTTRTFKSFAELSQHMAPELRKMGVSLPKAKGFHAPTAISFTLSVDAAIPSKKGVRIARVAPNLKVRTVNLSQATLKKYVKPVSRSTIQVTGRKAITDITIGLGVR